MDGAENQKIRLEKSFLVNGWISCGTADEQSLDADICPLRVTTQANHICKSVPICQSFMKHQVSVRNVSRCICKATTHSWNSEPTQKSSGCVAGRNLCRHLTTDSRQLGWHYFVLTNVANSVHVWFTWPRPQHNNITHTNIYVLTAWSIQMWCQKIAG